jgi:hypothetical protein
MAKSQKKAAPKNQADRTYTIITTTLLVLLTATSVYLYASMRQLDSKYNNLSDDVAQNAYNDTSQREDSIF